MISIASVCYSRQETLNKVLPSWLAQEEVDFEIILGVGPDIVIPNDPRIRTTRLDSPFNLWRAFNQTMAMSRGDLVVITQSDTLMTSSKLVKTLLNEWKPGLTVSPICIFDDGRHDDGLHLHCRLLEKSDIFRIGGMFEGFGIGYGYDDDDFSSNLSELGIKFRVLTPSECTPVTHLHHPRPNTFDPKIADSFEKCRKLYYSRHKFGIKELVQRQK